MHLGKKKIEEEAPVAATTVVGDDEVEEEIEPDETSDDPYAHLPDQNLDPEKRPGDGADSPDPYAHLGSDAPTEADKDADRAAVEALAEHNQTVRDTPVEDPYAHLGSNAPTGDAITEEEFEAGQGEATS